MKKSYCTQNNGDCGTCSLVNYGLDCRNQPLAQIKLIGSKRERAMANYNGHKGLATVEHVERNIMSAYPKAYSELTGVQYGKLMSVANNSYHDGQASNKIDTWAYDGDLDWLAGIRGTNTVIEVTADKITITRNAREDNAETIVFTRSK